MAKPGRRPVDFDEVAVYEAIKMGNTIEGAAIIVGVSADTLTRHCAELIKKAKAERSSTLQLWQFQLARQLDKTMLIWLGKQFLGQKDKREVESTGQNRLEIVETIKATRKPAKVSANGNGHANGNGNGTAPGAGRLH